MRSSHRALINHYERHTAAVHCGSYDYVTPVVMLLLQLQLASTPAEGAGGLVWVTKPTEGIAMQFKTNLH